MATPARAEEQTAQQADTQEKDSPLLDLSDAAVKRLIKTAKARGFVTLDQLNAVLPSQEVSPDQIEDTMSMLSDMGITVVESEEAEEGAADKDDAPRSAEEAEEGSRAMVAPSLPATTSARSEPTDRTDDPVRMYLRDMGSVELLSREGEIAIAKRIEAGREAMIAGLCESPLTFQAIIIWRDELNNAKILLRDIIDLEATYEGPEAKNAPPPMPGAARAAGARCRRPPRGDGEGDGEPRPEGEMDDEDDFENAMSLAAMEAELKPKVLETFDNIAGAYKKLRKLQDKRVEMHVANEQINRSAAEDLRQGARRDHQGRQEPLAQQRPHRDAGGAALQDQPQPRAAGKPPDAAGRQLRRAAPATSSTSTTATSWTRAGSTAWRRRAARSGSSSPSTRRST